MEYLCLVSLQERQLDALSKSEDDALVTEARACDEEGRRALICRGLLTAFPHLSDSTQVARR